MNMPAESAELFYPIEYEAYELRPDSAGGGKFRGGLGAIFKVRFLCDAELSMETSRTRKGSPGANGGAFSIPQRSTLIDADGSTKVIGGIKEDGQWTNPLLAGYRFGYDQQFMFETTGGGGWGNPFERTPDMVLEDVLDEYVSLEAAEKIYGVIIDPSTMTVAQEATSALRSRIA